MIFVLMTAGGRDVGGGHKHLTLDQINKFKPRQKDVGDVEVAF